MAGIAALSMVLCYLLASTQLAFPIKEWIEAKSETPVQAEAFACALHKCACQNALQCKVRCCCFPKASAEHGHHHDDGGLAAHLTACGGAADSHGLMPPLAPHVPSGAVAQVFAALIGETIPFLVPDLPSPFPDAALKVPILRA
jgi:hypothetical protein